LFSPFPTLINFWAYLLFTTAKSSGGGLPFCDRHRYYWTWRAWFIVCGLAAAIGLTILGAILTPPSRPGHDPNPHWVFTVGLCWLLLYLPAFLVVHLTSTRPIRGDRTWLELSGVNREFATSNLEAERNRA
jgi:hypothetical protein